MTSLLLFLALFTSPGYAGGYMGATDGAILGAPAPDYHHGGPVIRNEPN